MDGLTIPRSQISITLHIEKHSTCVLISWCEEWLWGNVLRKLVAIGEVVFNGGWGRFVAIIVFVDVVITTNGDHLISSFVGQQREEARL